MRHKRHYFAMGLIASLLVILVVLEGWTYYLGTPKVTFERLVGEKPWASLRDLHLRRYKQSALSPHLFRFRTEDLNETVRRLRQECGIVKIRPEALDRVVAKIDEETDAVMRASPWLYQSASYDFSDPSRGRLCILFRDTTWVYLFINGNLERIRRD